MNEEIHEARQTWERGVSLPKNGYPGAKRRTVAPTASEDVS